jgi:hypothetical protein
VNRNEIKEREGQRRTRMKEKNKIIERKMVS